jgi:predicted XRE-type DNA-binding protein
LLQIYQPMSTRAVLTGDIINSRQIQNKDHLINVLHSIFYDIESRFSPENPFEIFRGDSFQVLFKKPTSSLRVALLIKSGLMSQSNENQMYDARISIGIGSVAFPQNNVKIANGIAFELSGINLDLMKEKGRGIAIKSSQSKNNNTLETMNVLLDAIISKWTKNAAEVVYLSLLHGFTQSEIAEKLHISQSAVQQRLASAQYDAIYTYIRYFENLKW